MKRYAIVIVLLSSIAMAKVPAPCLEEEKMLIEKNIDLDTKTLKGWVRLLNNRSKMGQYGVILSKEETLELIKCLTEELNNRKMLGKLK